MFGFFLQLVKNAAQRAGPIIVRSGPVIGRTLEVAWQMNRGILKSPVRYFKSILNPRSHIQVLNRSANIIVKDVTPSVTAAAQTRAVAAFAMSTGVKAIKFAAKIKAKTVARKIVYDVAVPINATIHAYRLVRYPRIFIARTSAVERGLDRAVAGYVARTAPYKLNPRIDRTIVSGVRIALYGSSAYAGVKSYDYLVPRFSLAKHVNNPDPSSPQHPSPGLDRSAGEIVKPTPMPSPATTPATNPTTIIQQKKNPSAPRRR